MHRDFLLTFTRDMRQWNSAFLQHYKKLTLRVQISFFQTNIWSLMGVSRQKKNFNSLFLNDSKLWIFIIEVQQLLLTESQYRDNFFLYTLKHFILLAKSLINNYHINISIKVLQILSTLIAIHVCVVDSWSWEISFCSRQENKVNPLCKYSNCQSLVFKNINLNF